MSQLLSRRAGVALGAALLLAALAPLGVSAADGVFGRTAHGDGINGVQRLPELPTGSCSQCHSQGSEETRYPSSLWQENDNELCYTCHAVEDLRGTYPGQRIYQASPHSIDPRFIWPGPVPPPSLDLDAAGRCINCHDPHGSADENGLIPELLLAREDRLCLTCHNGSLANTDIAREMNKPFSHASRRAPGVHAADEGGDPMRYSVSGGARHVSCSDCHNAHASYPDPAPPMAPLASNLNAWVGRVRAFEGSPGMVPPYEYLAPLTGGADPFEYELCFKCHSSWTRQPPGQADLGLLLNLANASYHPVEGPGKNLNIPQEAFVPGIDATSMIYCSDCHGSDDSETRGPHGSQYNKILRRPYAADAGGGFVDSGDLCFQCHNYDTYANSFGIALEASRFNPPESPSGHAFHVGEHGVSCFACHDSHGSPRQIALMVTGRFPGLTQYTSTSTGGSCQSTCHDSSSYAINYPR